MKKTLTIEQVKKLFALCEKHEVYDYDVQIEMVDHLASAIEEKWQIEPELGFGWALKKSFTNLNWRTFRKLESKLTRQLKHKFRRILWQYFLEYFKLPKILITVALSLVILALLQLTERNAWIIALYFVPLSLFSLYYNFKIFPKKVDINPVDGKSFMILNYLKNIGNRTGSLVMLPPYILFFSGPYKLNYTNQLYQEIIISIFMALLTIFLYGYFFYLPQKVREHFFSNYPEYAQ